MNTNNASKPFRRRATAVVVHQDQVLGFCGEDPQSLKRYFFLPGGAIEDGERPAATAVRETLEETGYEIEVFEQMASVVHYDFFWNGTLYACETHFFPGKIVSQKALTVDDADYHRGVAWVAVDQLAHALSYSVPIKTAVLKQVQHLTQNITLSR